MNNEWKKGVMLGFVTWKPAASVSGCFTSGSREFCPNLLVLKAICTQCKAQSPLLHSNSTTKVKNLPIHNWWAWSIGTCHVRIQVGELNDEPTSIVSPSVATAHAYLYMLSWKICLSDQQRKVQCMFRIHCQLSLREVRSWGFFSELTSI